MTTENHLLQDELDDETMIGQDNIDANQGKHVADEEHLHASNEYKEDMIT